MTIGIYFILKQPLNKQFSNICSLCKNYSIFTFHQSLTKLEALLYGSRIGYLKGLFLFPCFAYNVVIYTK
jgi:hypothetical protein